MMKPFRIFLFGCFIFLTFYLFSTVIQKLGLKLLGTPIKTPSFSSFINPPKPQYKDISHIIKLSSTLLDSAKSIPVSDSLKPSRLKTNSPLPSHIPLKADSLRSCYRQIEFPPNSDTLFNSFFKEIGNLTKTENLIRILHYGDSQIEGDRITSYLRNQLQLQFGGSGIGLIPLISANPASMPYVYNISDNWKKYSPLAGASEEHSHRRYGALLNFARMDPGHSLFVKNKGIDGWVELKYPSTSYPLAQQSQICRIFYGFNKTPMMVEVIKNETVIDAEMLPASSSLKELAWDLQSPRNLKISFKGDNSPEIYGLALDAKKGIAVDNIPLRGSSGLEFTKTDMVFLQVFYRMLNVKLLILQFGVNIVPNVTSDYSYYEKAFYRQLYALKRAMPNLPILVLGVSDVSRNGENGYESYPNIEKIRDAQKKAAFATGCAFWDIFEAMGGHNSMPSWVLANPPLAQKDFVHFSPIGAKIIGEMFYRSFMHEYDKYVATTAEKNKGMIVNN